MTDTTTLSVLPGLVGSNATATSTAKTTAIEPKGRAVNENGQNEGSFLDFLNAFNALSSTDEQGLDGVVAGGSSLPLAAQTAESGHLQAQSLLQDFTTQGVTAESAGQGEKVQLGSNEQPTVTTAPVLTTQLQATGDAEVPVQNQVTPQAAVVDEGLTAEVESSAQLASAALASRLVGLGQGSESASQVASTSGVSNNNQAVLSALNPVAADAGGADLVAQQAGQMEQPVVASVSAQAVAAPVSSTQLSGRAQLSTKADAGIKELSARPGATGVQQSATTAATDTDLNTAIMQTADAEMSETDMFFAAQVKKMVAEQQGNMNPERQLAQNMTTSSTINQAATDPVSASAVRAGSMQSVFSLETPASTSYQATLSEPFGRPEWNQGMGKQVLWMANQNIRSAELRLNPAHLGPIEVRIEVEDDQVNLAFTSRHAAVREAVEQAMPRLREMFEESGLNLAETDISQQSFAEQRSQQAADFSGQQSRGFATQVDNLNAEDTIVTEQTHRLSDSLVDYYI